MQQQANGLLWGLLLVTFAYLVNGESVWTYECQTNRCLKVEATDQNRSISLPVCRLFCGHEIGTLWPYPTGEVKVANTVAHFDIYQLQLSTGDPAHSGQQALWQKVHDRFKAQIKAKAPPNFYFKSSGKAVNFKYVIEKDDTYFTLDTDESYILKVSEVDDIIQVTITAATFFGARHAMETLQQLIVFDDLRNELLVTNDVHIEDSPAFKHRGLILDTSRNYYSIKSIKRTIEAMSMSKLNIFHWHITDSHSFPLVIKSHPDLVEYGAYQPKKIYTAEDVKDVVNYARIRGVTVLPEFDAPAHVGEGWQHKDVTACFNAQPWAKYCVEPPCGQLDPTQDHLYDILEDIYREMLDMFEHPYAFHMGGDEVSAACWNTSTRIQEWMKTQGWQLGASDFIRLWGHFQENALSRVDKVATSKKPIILWTSHLTDVPYVNEYLDKERYFIQIWTTGHDSKISDLLKAGFKLIISNYDALYLDCGFGGWVTDGNNWCSPYIGWQKVYDNSMDKIAGPGYEQQILGAEAALWSEQADEQTVDSRLWPRASALAERLWTNPTLGWRAAESRMLLHREHLVENGIAAESLQPEWCVQNEGDCPA